MWGQQFGTKMQDLLKWSGQKWKKNKTGTRSTRVCLGPSKERLSLHTKSLNWQIWTTKRGWMVKEVCKPIPLSCQGSRAAMPSPAPLHTLHTHYPVAGAQLVQGLWLWGSPKDTTLVERVTTWVTVSPSLRGGICEYVLQTKFPVGHS